MKIDEKKMEAAFQAYMKNPGWKAEYDKAPTEACKEHYRYKFYYSKYYSPDTEDANEFIEMLREQEKKLSIEDWEYLRDSCGNSPYKKVCNDRIKELEKKDLKANIKPVGAKTWAKQLR